MATRPGRLVETVPLPSGRQTKENTFGKFARFIFRTLAFLFLLFYIFIALIILHPQWEKLFVLIEDSFELTAAGQTDNQQNLLVHFTQIFYGDVVHACAGLLFVRKCAEPPSSSPLVQKITDTSLNLDPLNGRQTPVSFIETLAVALDVFL